MVVDGETVAEEGDREMLRSLRLEDLGPARKLEVELSNRPNVFTGDERCRKRGLAWIKGKGPNWRDLTDTKRRTLRPPSYWTDFLPELQDAFLGRVRL